MFDLVKSIALGALRTTVAGAVPAMIQAGILQANQTNDFIGSVCFLGAIGFSVIDKFVVNKKIVVALATPVPAAQGAAQ